MERHLFAGGNTAEGFVSFYDNVVRRRSCQRFIVIKGGSGVGKSTLLGKVGKAFAERGEEVEYFHCTADIDSLDGIGVARLGIGLVDGTNPHVTEPKYVKVSDFVLDLSNYMDERAIRVSKDRLAMFMDEKEKCYQNAYAMLKGAGAVFSRVLKIDRENISFSELDKVVGRLLKRMIIKKGEGIKRELFAGGLSSEGEVYLPSTISTESLIRLTGDRDVASILLDRVFHAMELRRADMQCLYAPIQQGVIYELNVGGKMLFTINDKVVGGKTYEVLGVQDLLQMSRENDRVARRECLETYRTLVDRASVFLQKAKLIHSEIESIYKPSVDFVGINKRTEELILELTSPL